MRIQDARADMRNHSQTALGEKNLIIYLLRTAAWHVHEATEYLLKIQSGEFNTVSEHQRPLDYEPMHD